MEKNIIKKQIVIFGGSFNPPLNSHLFIAEQLLNIYKEIEKIIFVPVNSKYKKQGLESNEHRYKMVKMICDKNDKLEVSRLEIDNDRQLYTLETLEEFKKIYSNYEICFIIGADNLIDLNTWYGKEKLVKNFRFYVIERGNEKIEKIIEKYEFLKLNKNSFIKVDEKIKSNLSSTFIRNEIKEGKNIKYFAPDEVIKYIEKNKLYKN